MFSKVCFKGEILENDFFKITTKEIPAKFVNNDAIITFDTLKVSKKNWSDVEKKEMRFTWTSRR